MKSFELMDTLFTRFCKREDQFEFIEKNYPYPEFKQIRLTAEMMSRLRGDFKLDTIYEIFKGLIHGKKDLEIVNLLKEYELNLEIENSLPIQCNINFILHDDFFITDDYFNLEQLKRFFDKHCIPEQKMYRIKDIDMPESDIHIGTNSKMKNLNLTNLHAFTFTEILLYDSPILKQIRGFRLKNPYPQTDSEYKIYHDQVCYDLPILLLFCIQVKSILDKEERNRVLFCSNGLYVLFSSLFPEIESILFSTSNLIHLHPTSSYKNYVQKVYQDKTTLIVDLCGFFKKDVNTYQSIFGCIPRVHVLLHDFEFDYSSLTYCIECLETNQIPKDYIDRLRYDSRGVLFSMVDGLELRLHETQTTPSLKHLLFFSQELSCLATFEFDVPLLIRKLIEKGCLN